MSLFLCLQNNVPREFNMSRTKTLIMTALMIAIGVALPFVIIRSQQVRTLISPMHIAPLLAGLVAGPLPGLATGILSPLLSSLLTGMPMAPVLPGMVVELGVYGLAGGLCMKYLKLTGMKKVYVSLIIAMILGRIAGGLLHAFVLDAGSYSLSTWVSSYLVATAPGMVVHLILIPLVYSALHKAHLTYNS